MSGITRYIDRYLTLKPQCWRFRIARTPRFADRQKWQGCGDSRVAINQLAYEAAVGRFVGCTTRRGSMSKGAGPSATATLSFGVGWHS
jgi:hypothetical protein